MRFFALCLLLVGCDSVTIQPKSDGTDSGTSYVDGDGDGYTYDIDCDDSNSYIHPNADDPEGDDVDSDCDGVDG